MKLGVAGGIVLVLALIALVVGYSALFTVYQTQQALVVRLGQPVRVVTEPGLHFKVPLIDDVIKFDRRVLTRKFDNEQFLTSESQVLAIDYYIKWRIQDVEAYYQATAGGSESRAEDLVGQRIQDGIKNAVARRTLKEIVISDRQQVTGEFMERSSESLKNLGIQLIDVRVQSIRLQEDVAARVYESMKQTFEGIARTQRGEGDREAQIIRSEAERKRTEIIAKANADAQKIRGDGDATAAALYAAAYNRNTEFYAFYRSLLAYRTSLGREGDVLVVSPDSEFFKYLKSPSPQRK
jgi:modulator of FtsH protease HflC